jgi:hypothetical protein
VCNCAILNALSVIMRLRKAQSKVLVPQLLVSIAGRKLVSVIKVL